MQASKILLSGTAVVLAIAAAFTTKASRTTAKLTGYTCDVNKLNSHKIQVYTQVQTDNSTSPRTVFHGLNNRVYTSPSALSACGHTIFTKNGD